MGCGIGYGYLHRIPEREEDQKPVDPEVGVAVDVPDGRGQGVESNPNGYDDVGVLVVVLLWLHALFLI